MYSTIDPNTPVPLLGPKSGLNPSIPVITDMRGFREQAIEGMGDAGISFQPDGGEVFTVPHPLLVSDAVNEKLTEAMGFVDIAKTLLNTPDDPGIYDRFAAAGGQAGDVMLAWRRLQNGLGAPKSRGQ